MKSFCLLLLFSAAACVHVQALDPLSIPRPRVLDDRLQLDLFCSEPDIVTPISLDVDDRGRVWVIESHTHKREAGYSGPASDRLLTIEDRDGDGRADSFRVFADGFRHAMGVYWREEGVVYLSTRMTVYRLVDVDGDGICDERHRIVGLDKGSYPHDGLSGLAFDELDNLYIGMGENLGVPYKLSGAGGRALSGGTEGGDVFRIRSDGTGLQRWATGFWNAFHCAFDARGRLFVVDNDPDSRPPCRILDVQRGGDYGYRFWLGRKGLHPFTSWNGHLPGTLPMAAGTGEAPSAVVPYDHVGLPESYRGRLLVTSWGDYRIESFQPRTRGVSVSSYPEVMIQGNEQFRPVGMAVAPDGSVFFSDWVDKSYPVHGKGRIWRIRTRGSDALIPAMPAVSSKIDELVVQLDHPARRMREVAARHLRNWPGVSDLLKKLIRSNAGDRARYQALCILARRGELEPGDVEASPALFRAAAVRLYAESSADASKVLLEWMRDASLPMEVRVEALLHIETPLDIESLAEFFASDDPFVRSAALFAASRVVNDEQLIAGTRSEDARVRLYSLLALKRISGMGRGFVPFGDRRIKVPLVALRRLLGDADVDVRRAAIQWVGEEDLRSLRPYLASTVKSATDPSLLDAYLATAKLLDGENPRVRDKETRDKMLLAWAGDEKLSTDLRIWALRSIPATSKEWHEKTIRDLLVSEPLAFEMQRSLRGMSSSWRRKYSKKFAENSEASFRVRRAAIVSLALDAKNEREVLLRIVRGSDERLAFEASRSLRGVVLKGDDAKRVRELGQGSVSPHARGTPEWKRWILEGGDPVEGEVLFFHPAGPRCSTCHRAHGRGGLSGPDLSSIGLSSVGQVSREKILDSILEPRREIAPQFVLWTILMRGGGLEAGVRLGEDSAGRLRLGAADGHVKIMEPAAILEMRQEEGTLMPDGLLKLMSDGELRDLVAFLASSRATRN